jgi:hypothetical protein
VKPRIRIVVLSVLLSAATVVAVFVVTPPSQAAPPPDVTPLKVAATTIGEGHAVYVRGTDARLYWRTVEEFAAPGYSTSWRALPGGTVGSGPDVAQVESNSLVIAARADNGNLLVREQNGTAFGAWLNLGGVITTAPILAASSTTPQVAVFARGGDGAVWYRIRGVQGTWSPWASIGGIVTSAPDAIWGSPEAGIAVFARGGNGTRYRINRSPENQWGQWEGGAGTPLNSATSTFPTGQEFSQYHRNGARHVIRTEVFGPTDLGGVVISAPDVADETLVAAVGTNRALYVHTGGAWSSLGGIAA